MNLSITTRFFVFAFVIMLAYGLSLTSVFAAHSDEEATHTIATHSDEDTHEEHVGADPDDTPQIAQMKALIALLTQLVALLQEQAELSDSHTHGDSHEDGDTDEFAVWIEIHSNRTHVHVQEPGKELETFFLDEYDYTEETAIIDAIAKKTGISTHEIEDAITFPTGEVDENGDSIDEASDDHEHGDEDLDGLHIMADGTIMLGNGKELDGATITDNGMIMLADGDIVEPEFDLR